MKMTFSFPRQLFDKMIDMSCKYDELIKKLDTFSVDYEEKARRYSLMGEHELAADCYKHAAEYLQRKIDVLVSERHTNLMREIEKIKEYGILI